MLSEVGPCRPVSLAVPLSPTSLASHAAPPPFVSAVVVAVLHTLLQLRRLLRCRVHNAVCSRISRSFPTGFERSSRVSHNTSSTFDPYFSA